MKSDVEVELKEGSVSVQAAGKHNKRQLKKLGKQAAAGSSMMHKVMGTDVEFELVEVPADKVDMKTMVYLGNERNQDLLDAHAVSDLIKTFEEQGQQVPAFARMTCGIIEIADGSRRRYAAIETQQPFYVWVGELTTEQMEYLSEIGNQYKDTSAYEKGQRYNKLLKKATQEEVSEAVGISRKAMMRCVNTAKLPQEFIRCFASPNELSARKGEVLFKLYNKLDEERQVEIVEFCNTELMPTKGDHDKDHLIEQFTVECVGIKTVPAKPEPRILATNATVIVKNGHARFDVKNISPESQQAIEQAITKIIDQEILDNC